MRSRSISTLLSGALLLLLPGAGQAFVIQTARNPFGRPVQQFWRNLDQGIPFIIDSAGSDDLLPQTAQRILRESFQVWESVTSARVRFADQGLSSSLQPRERDGHNLVIFDETGRWLGAPSGTGIIALTRIDADPVSGQMIDTDIIFNGRDFRFGIGAQSGRVDLKDVAVHEIGHLLGLDHTPLDGPPATRPTMNPFSRGDGAGEASSLEADDITGISVLYPAPDFLLHSTSISGRVTDIEKRPLFGVQLVAENVDNGRLYSTLSGADPQARDRGSYILRGLPPGQYRIHIEPVQGRINEDNFGGIFTGFDTDFPREFFDNLPEPGLAEIVAAELGRPLENIDFVTGFQRPGFPFISPFFAPVNTPNTRDSYAVRARVEDAVRVALNYRLESDAQPNTVPMTPAGPNLYEAAIPAQPVGSRILYRIEAESKAGNTSFLPAADRFLDFEVVGLSGAPLAFTVARDEGVVDVLDTDTQKRLARIPVGDDPIQTQLGAEGRKLFVSNLGSSEISVIETETFQLLERIEVAAEPLDMALSPDGRTLYVTNSGASSLTAIDIASGALTRLPVPLAVNSGPFGVAAAGDNLTLYLSDLNGNQVIALDRFGRTLERLSVPEPRSLAMSPDRRILYVTSFNTPTLTLIDAERRQIVGRIPLPVSGTFAVAPSPDGRKVYLTAHQDNALVVVDAPAAKVLSTLAIGANPRALSFAPGGRLLFITSAGSNEIFVLDTRNDALVGRYATGDSPRGIAVIAPPATKGQITAVLEEKARPRSFVLAPNFPNPFNASTQIAYTLPGPGSASVEIAVYNILGQKVRTLARGAQAPGRYQITWDGRDAEGRALASGVYLLVLRAPDRKMVQKMLLLR